LRDQSGVPSGKRGFIVITSPQVVTAQAEIIQRNSFDPGMTDTTTAMMNSLTPLVLRVEPFGQGASDDRGGLASSRIAISNPGAAAANVQLVVFNSSGTPAGRLTVRVVGGGEFFTEDIVGAVGLPPIFQGSMTITSDAPVLVYNQRSSGETGAVVPVFPGSF
jgi:hypothetical protein